MNKNLYIRHINTCVLKNVITQSEKQRIDSICHQYTIENYSINLDGSIDVAGCVNLTRRNLTKLPLIFNNVAGDFYCVNNELTSLKGSPTTVGGEFYCGNNLLTSLFGAPIRVGWNFNCKYNNLTNLIGGPTKVGGDFNCNGNNLTSLVGAPEYIGGDFITHDQLPSLEGAPTSVGGNFDCSSNNLTSTYSGDIDIEIGGSIYLYVNNLYHDPFYDNRIKLILKYQRHFFIWDDDLTLNEENFQMLIDDIDEGLK